MPYVVDSVECELYSAEEIERLAVVEVYSCLYEHSLPMTMGRKMSGSVRPVGRSDVRPATIPPRPADPHRFRKTAWPVYHSMYMDTI